MEKLFKLSVNVPVASAKRLRRMRHDYGLSASSIVELALEEYFRNRSEAAVAKRARESGATLRRDPRERPAAE